MQIYTYEGKNIDELKEKAFTELNTTEDDVFIKISEEEAGIFKSKKIKIEILKKDEILSYLKQILSDIVSKMGIKANIEAKIRDNNFKLSLYSDNNAILIGREGRTIDSLQTILKNAVSNKTHFRINVSLDVENYKEKQLKRIIRLARNVALQTLETGVEAKLDSMNSYERRLVHEEVSKIEGVHTVSEGEEPNRYVVIKLNE
ncbi:MAG: KH domain-containing protein [Bacilli bacterium]|nr:KH domain-containing protein [Bacilli bacterium]